MLPLHGKVIKMEFDSTALISLYNLLLFHVLPAAIFLVLLYFVIRQAIISAFKKISASHNTSSKP